MIVDGFFNTIHCTLGMLIENTGDWIKAKEK
jgi:uncharacterized protein HemY